MLRGTYQFLLNIEKKRAIKNRKATQYYQLKKEKQRLIEENKKEKHNKALDADLA